MVINSVLQRGESRLILAVEDRQRGARVAVVEGESLRHLYPRPGKTIRACGGRVSCGGSGLVPATLKVLSVAEEAQFWASPRR